ncbi:MAG: hypothetical protein VX015_09830 [Planctomycetota bacterium]|nr:hypothetical protein [Planctomycetota bacterium]
MRNEPNDPSPPALQRVRSRERRLLAVFAATLFAVALVTWWTVPSDAGLIERARSHPDVEVRIESMNALVLRGYWEARPTRELKLFLEDQPEEVRRFVQQMHPNMLNSRRDALLENVGDGE